MAFWSAAYNSYFAAINLASFPQPQYHHHQLRLLFVLYSSYGHRSFQERQVITWLEN